MDTNQIDLEPEYSTSNITGRCVKCLAEKELNDCLMELLREETDGKKAQEKFELLVAFLKSPVSQKLLDESEKYLSEGKQVTVRIINKKGKFEYELQIKNREVGGTQ